MEVLSDIAIDLAVLCNGHSMLLRVIWTLLSMVILTPAYAMGDFHVVPYVQTVRLLSLDWDIAQQSLMIIAAI